MKSRSLIVGLVVFLLVVGIASAAYIEYYGTITGTAEVGVSSNWVGWWRFNEGEGDTAVDSSSYGNDGTLYNGTVSCSGGECPKWVSGDYGTALEFDGEDDYVRISNSECLNLSKEVTLEAWININKGESSGVIAGKADENKGYALGLHNSRIAFLVDGDPCPASEVTINTGSWYHIAGTYSGSTMKIYINGSLEDTSSSKTLSTNDYPFTIGAAIEQDPDYIFKGKIDDVRIFNVSLSQEEIKNSFESSCEKYNAC